MVLSNFVSQSVPQVKINRRYFALLDGVFVSLLTYFSNIVQISNATFQPVSLPMYWFYSR